MADNKTENKATESKTVATVEAPAVVNTLIVRFAQRDSQNPKAPVAEAEVLLPGLLTGLVLNASVWARRDTRGQITDYDVSFPTAGRGRQVIDVAPIFAKMADGKLAPIHKSQDPNGAKASLMFPVEASRAYREFLKTGNPEQVISW